MHGSQASIPLHQTEIYTEQGHGHTNWMKMLTTLMSRETSLDVWNMNSDQTDRCRTLLVKATVYPVSVVPVRSAHEKPRQGSGHYAKTVNFKWNLTGHLTEVVGNYLLSSCILSSVYGCKVSNYYMYEHFCFWAQYIHDHFFIMIKTSILGTWCFGTRSLYYERDVSALCTTLHSYFAFAL